jgi:ribosomal protein L19E
MRKLSLLVQQCKQETKQRRDQDTLNCLRAKGELAEALYYDAYFKNKDGKFELQIQQFKNWLKIIQVTDILPKV